MALKKCNECEQEVSTKADNCPSCGAPITSIGKSIAKTKIGCLGSIVILIVIGFLFSELQECTNRLDNKKRIAKQRESDRKEKERKKLILKKEAEEHKKIAAEFNSNKEKILNSLNSLINQNKFNLVAGELKKYDIPELSTDLTEIKKNLSEARLREKEIQLYEKVKKIPAKNYSENYKLYDELTKLNPQKELYKNKRDFYKVKFAEKEYQLAKKYFNKSNQQYRELSSAFSNINTALNLRPGQKKYIGLKKKLEWEKLRFYEGNDKVQMALVYEGYGDFWVSIKNTGSNTYHVNPNDFTLICKDNHSYHYDSSDGIMVDLQPGTETSGRITFNTRSKPKELIYSNWTAGKISRICP